MSLVSRPDASIEVTDRGADPAVDEVAVGEGSPVLLLHGLAGSSREMVPTADVLTDRHRVLLMDQRGHGRSTRRPADVSREAFVGDVIAVLEESAPGQRCTLVGQSMGAHTAFLVAATRPDLVERLVMLEGHVAGSVDPEAAAAIGRFFAAWPTPFADAAAARAHLGDGAIARAWIDDLEQTPEGLRPRFDADIMERTIAAVHAPRWEEWEVLDAPTLVVFAKDGMFTSAEEDELIRRRPSAGRVDLSSGSHDAHLDAFEEWIDALRRWLGCGQRLTAVDDHRRAPAPAGCSRPARA